MLLKCQDCQGVRWFNVTTGASSYDPVYTPVGDPIHGGVVRCPDCGGRNLARTYDKGSSLPHGQQLC